ncbi:Maf family protein [Engelhardtia mirabilis]|uniref:dTTP/UTP pyrophosphatase n=1 Tax=Engelhardtia mirabilis TaxID=2528011 RepID=A0A518BLV2_9BACT|nr:Maf-like protein YhdE [Planctomycetes bacterium Pla133]QDV02281.1 Maf-like protein YhdE [Planctomycetes bacterium Pla86]
MAHEAIVLASASPRRHALLREAGLAFDVLAANVDESLDGAPEPEAAAAELAQRKAAAVRESLGDGAQGRWLIGADTIVAVPASQGWLLLGKAADSREAAGMLRSLSGTTHRVVTGVCVLGIAAGGRATAHAATETTAVTMRELTAEEIDAYVASGEWRDKAGGYAIQESADRFVTELTGGGFDNVVGLPVALTLELLESAGAPLPLRGGQR